MYKRIINNVFITLVVGMVIFYITIPPLNLQSMAFWGFVFQLVVVYFILDFKSNITSLSQYNLKSKTKPFIFFGLLVVVIILINIFYSPLINAKMYANRIDIDESQNFLSDIQPVDFSTLPLLDRDSSLKLGDRVMGQLPELVSQFDVSPLYTQINYHNRVVRVTPLEYNGVYKYLINRKNGVKGYISVDSVDGSTDLVKLEKGMKYVPSGLFNEKLQRKLRLQYPTFIFGKENFEIDENGAPFFVVPVFKYKGIGLLEDVKGVVILDPITGESKFYTVNDVPTWVDHVYPAELLIQQIDDWGLYKNGFFNSIFGQKNVVKTTRGYNYIAKDDDIYLYTGITSTLADESNIGFVLSNMRTKETTFYSVPGAEETSAMESAKGQVQQMNYTASFPLLINLNNQPTYLISLKDNAGLVKMYAFVDVQDYQKVVVTDASQGIEKAAQNYIGDKNVNISMDESEYMDKTITVKDISTAIIDGNTYYYIVDQDGHRYRAKINVGEMKLPFVGQGDELNISYQNEAPVTEIYKIS